MKTISQNILFWCLLAAFVPCVLSATIPPNSDGEKKVNAEHQKKDLCVHNRSSEDSVENRDTGPPISQTSDQPSGRMKRGCNLLTCSIHDLAYRINQLSNKTSNAPPRKISPCGYGRRRRRSLLRRSTTPTHGRRTCQFFKPTKKQWGYPGNYQNLCVFERGKRGQRNSNTSSKTFQSGFIGGMN